MKSVMLLVACLAVGGLSSTTPDTSVAKEGFVTEEACPPCELLFRNLKRISSDGKLAQVVRVQERGEAKSGTDMMFDWATGALVRSCDYLKYFFGEETHVTTVWTSEINNDNISLLITTSLTRTTVD